MGSQADRLVTVALGGNVGDRLKTLRSAVDGLSKLGAMERVSPIYETIALTAPGMYSPDAPRFLNAVIQLRTVHSPPELLSVLLDIERYHQRSRDPKQRWGPRTLDLDIIAIEDVVVELSELTIPHPEMHRRSFVLCPLCDIDPDWVHPLLKRSARELLADLPREEFPPYRIQDSIEAP